MVDLFSDDPFQWLGKRGAVLVVGLALLVGPQAVLAQTQGVYTVDTANEGVDQEPGDGVCATSQGSCTLRAAIQEANATFNEIPDTIEFDITDSPPHVIRPDSALPEIVAPVVVDGRSEPDYDGTPVVELNGTNAGAVDGLRVGVEGGGKVYGMAIVNFDTGLSLLDDLSGNVIRGCYVGVRTDGVTAASNNRGIFVGASAPNTTIGGGETGEGNIISGNSDEGIDLTGSMTVLGNRIGVDSNGDPLGNGGAGVSTNADGATIGGLELEQGNVIAYNGGDGIEVIDLTPPNTQNTIRGNQIYANDGLGIDLEGGTENAEGRTQNDPGDGDDGQNRLQNFPELSRSSYAPATGEVTVTYLVPSDPGVDASGASSYPLTIDFYVADAEDEEGRTYLGTDAYTAEAPNDYSGCGSPPCAVSTTFVPESSVAQGDDLLAVATDLSGNTSEFGPTTVLSFPPEVATTSATDVTSFGATFNGQVNPDGAETAVTFEYFPTGAPEQIQTVEADQSPLTGTQEQSVSAQIAQLRPNTEYEVRVVATSTAGTTQGDVVGFSTPSLDLTVSPTPQVPSVGTSAEIEVTVPELFSPFEAQLFYRRGGTQEYQTRPLEQTGASIFEATVPETAVTERGVEYYVRLEGERAIATVPDRTPSETPLFLPARISSTGAEVTLASEQYQMVSIPVQADVPRPTAILGDDFGSSPPRDWRLLRWKPGGQQPRCGGGEYENLTLEGEGESSQLIPGQAYWLIARSGGTFNVEEARSVEDAPFTLTLPPGWNQIANPFPFPVAWSDVMGREALQNGAPFAFEPGTGAYAPNVSVLEPWTGYWVCNPGEDSVDVAIPRQETDQATERASRTAHTGGPEAFFGQEITYALTLTASLGPGEKTRSKDMGMVAVGPHATPELGGEDIVAPPPIQDGLRLSIVEDGTKLVGSVRPEREDGQTWDFTLSVPADMARSQTARVHLETHGALPSDFERRVIDRETGREIPIRKGGVSVGLSENRTSRRLRLVVGTPQYTEEVSEAIRPDRSALRAVYPNPSTGPVTIDYQLRTAQHVRIDVYDVLGRRVETLINTRQSAGPHTLRWAGGDKEQLASGVYIMRLEAASTTDSKQISILR